MLNRRSFLAALVLVPMVGFPACGGTVETSGGHATAGSGGSHASAGPASSTVTGPSTGTSTSSTATSSTTTSTTTTTGASTSTSTSSTSSTATGGGCTSYLDLVVDNAAPAHLASVCAGASWNPTMSAAPLGYGVAGGPPPGVDDLHLEGCESAAANAQGLTLVTPNAMGPGMFTAGSASYVDPVSGVWTTMQGGNYQLTLTKLGPVGDSIEGTFSAWVGQPNKQQARVLTGSFHVCRVPDELVP